MIIATSIHERLSCVEETFLRAAIQGLPALDAFHDEWFTLLHDTEDAVQTNTITQETKVLASVVSSRVATLSNCLLDFQISANAIETELEAAFAQVDIRDRVNGQSRRSSQPTSTSFRAQNREKPLACNPSTKRGLHPVVNVDPEFASIKPGAKNLNSEEYSERTLTSQLDVVIKDIASRMKHHANVSNDQFKREERVERLLVEQDRNTASSYPSPYRSPRILSEPPLPSDDFDLLTIPSMSLAGCKRTFSSRCLAEYNTERQEPRPNKRSRFDVTSDVAALTNSFLSSARSSDELLPTDDGIIVASPISSISTLALPAASRKRRLSDGDTQSNNKRPRNILSEPRLHAVSDPFSTWFESHSSIHSAAIVDKSALPETYGLEVYDYSKSITNALSGGAESSINNCAKFAMPSEIPLPAPQMPPYILDVSTSDFDYNEIFCASEDISFDNFMQNDVDLPHDSAFPILGPAVLEFNLTQTSFDTAPTLSDTVVIADPSANASQNPASDFDWIFPPLLHNIFDSTEGFELNDNVQDGTFTFRPLKASPPAMVHNTVAQTFVGAEKIAKQRKLREMREATRRLEAEIAAS